MFAFEFDLHMRMMPFFKAIVAIALAMLLIELWLIIAIIVGRNDGSKLRHRIILLFGVSLLVFFVGQTCGAISEIKGRIDLDMLMIQPDAPTDMLDFKKTSDIVNHIELDYRFVQALYNIITTFGISASLLFWTFMRKRLGLDQSPNPSTI